LATEFTAGINSFKIQGNSDSLLVGSSVAIEILDAAGNPIEYRINNRIDRLKRRLISILIYPTAAPGFGSIIIAGTATWDMLNNKPIPEEWKNKINVKWIKKIYIDPLKQNESDIIFNDLPKVKIEGITTKRTLVNYPGYNNQCSYSGSYYTYHEEEPKSIFISSKLKYFYIPDLNVYENSVEYIRNHIGNNIKTQILSGSNYQNYAFYTYPSITDPNRYIQIPEVYAPAGHRSKINKYNAIALIEDIKGSGSELMITNDLIGGDLVVKDPVNPTPVYQNAATSTYRAKIIDILSKNILVLDEPYSYIYDNNTYVYNKFDLSEHEMYWASTPKYDYSKIDESGSFMKITLDNLSLLSGDITKIKTYIKSKSYKSDYTLLSENDVSIKNIFITDESILDSGVGIFSNYIDNDDLQSTWILTNPLAPTEARLILDNSYLLYGISIQNPAPNISYHIYSTKENHYFANNEYRLLVDLVAVSDIPNRNSSISFYMSGSAFIGDQTVGKLVGNIDVQVSNIKRYNIEFNFSADYTGFGTPLIIVDTPNWHIANIKIIPLCSIGFTPSVYTYYIPVPKDRGEDTVSLKIEFINQIGRCASELLEIDTVKLLSTGGTPGESYWQEDGSTHLKPVDNKTVYLKYIDPTTIVSGSITDSSKISFWKNAYEWIYTTFSDFKTSLWGTGTINEVLHGGDVPTFSSVIEDDISLSDVTANNVTIDRHGFAPKLPGFSNIYFDGSGNYSVPAGTVNSYKIQSFTDETIVTVIHNFNSYPVVQIITDTGYRMLPKSIKDDSTDQFTVTFAGSTSGYIIATIGSTQPQDVKVITADYEVQLGDKILCCIDPVEITMLPIGNVGLEYRIDNASSSNVMVIPNGVDTIEGETFQIIPPESAMNIYDNGIEWRFC